MTQKHDPTAFNQLKALIVDDDEMQAEFLAIQLESLGCQADVASSAEQALGMLEDAVDLLVTDWQMPHMDGMALVRRARTMSGSERHLHIAMMTASESGEARSAALQAGVDNFPYKPIEPVQLELVVATARRNRLLHRRLKRRNALLAKAHAQTREALQRVRTDLDAAATLHERLLPKAERIDTLEVEHLYRPAQMLGGDTIGTFNLGSGKTLFFLIDVRGHGVPAALESFHLHHRLKQMRPDGPERLEQAVQILNDEMVTRGDDSYATLLCGIVDAPGQQGFIIRAGHPPPVLLTARRAEQIEEGGSFPVGMFAEAAFAATRFSFRAGDRLIIYSDGLTECIDRSGRELGTDNPVRLLVGCAERNLQNLIDNVELILGLRQPHDDLQDDVSLLALEHLGLEG